jgi:hypothetical protein
MDRFEMSDAWGEADIGDPVRLVSFWRKAAIPRARRDPDRRSSRSIHRDLEPKGHPIGATGLGQICEPVSQLRGEPGPRQVAAARIAIAENGGGIHGIEEAVACITLLGH